ncbi:hypothetical protein TSTA_101940 [Talaromyces stipitatus ATCC 10500]|uniref:Clr5 domain-containing protein n=1 Tax=Talaromyces stipitatus (strain ATCC 10500 / CBS 375.48 / QM 6759 / NRRL 1006) TaxID=441959 RepID=B8MN09_TALSN|nr:uncharacterized protein TSTA_101940 [Talaromyces stipitatus ATCC 10500]EED13958.1 hypothetical protein TSTA_101940 [Talaromyces stipitatus ATCC 10500]
MPVGRPPSQIDQYKQEISTSFQNGQSISNITKMLSDEYQITIHPETIRRRLKQWGVSRTNPGPRELEDKIKELYFKQGLRNKEIIRALERDGIKISQSTLTTIQLRIGLQRQVIKLEDIQHTDDIVREAELDPDGVQHRKNDFYWRRGEYVVPSPNYIWSMDGHDKLAFWGIQIYAAIDAFSQYVTWCYVKISNRT